MATRLALVAYDEFARGPWTPVRGDESLIRVHGLREGEWVQLQARNSDDDLHQIFRGNGSFPFPWHKYDFYRVSKHSEKSMTRSTTTVEILLK